MVFKISDKVVCPGHGVAVVEDIIEKSVVGKNVQFLKLIFLFKDMTILVPTYNVDAVGVRLPSDKETVLQALGLLRQKPARKLEGIDFTPSGWNRRNKDYQLKIQGGKLIEIAEIYRDLMYVSLQKDLSFGERSLLQTTEELLVQELQVIRKVPKEDVIQEVRCPFKQFVFHEKNYGHEAASPAL
ncbi:hypothetical protein K2W90_03950 [Candidatus Babeliales bacterium]|nr:hypothetical protein [Candidatus Babeliales bacterium]